jgi:hypothetical protein
MMADFWLLAGLALQRHNTFNSNALDLGYHDQVIWNTLQGRPFRITLYRQDEQARFWVDVPLDQIRDPDSLLSYHVEPLLVLIAPIYWLWNDVRALLLLQAGALTLGAWPAYRLGRRQLGHGWAGLAVALLWLLAPARQAAALSDFHTVAIAAPLFLLALDALDTGKTRLFLLASTLCLIAREDTAIIVIALALYAAVFHPRQRRPALMLTGVSLLYLYLVTRVIMPYYNGLAGPTYLYRYTTFSLLELAPPARCVGLPGWAAGQRRLGGGGRPRDSGHRPADGSDERPGQYRLAFLRGSALLDCPGAFSGCRRCGWPGPFGSRGSGYRQVGAGGAGFTPGRAPKAQTIESVAATGFLFRLPACFESRDAIGCPGFGGGPTLSDGAGCGPFLAALVLVPPRQARPPGSFNPADGSAPRAGFGSIGAVPASFPPPRDISIPDHC